MTASLRGVNARRCFRKERKEKENDVCVQAKKIVVDMAMTKYKKVELDRAHTQGKGCERLFYCIRVDPRGTEGERKSEKRRGGRAGK